MLGSFLNTAKYSISLDRNRFANPDSLSCLAEAGNDIVLLVVWCSIPDTTHRSYLLVQSSYLAIGNYPWFAICSLAIWIITLFLTGKSSMTGQSLSIFQIANCWFARGYISWFSYQQKLDKDWKSDFNSFIWLYKSKMFLWYFSFSIAIDWTPRGFSLRSELRNRNCNAIAGPLRIFWGTWAVCALAIPGSSSETAGAVFWAGPLGPPPGKNLGSFKEMWQFSGMFLKLFLGNWKKTMEATASGSIPQRNRL